MSIVVGPWPGARPAVGGHAFERLVVVSWEYEAARGELFRAVKEARAAGWSWDDIAEATCWDLATVRRAFGPGPRHTLL